MSLANFREVMAAAAAFLQLEDAYKTLSDLNIKESEFALKGVDAEAEKLLLALNFVVSEIACDYFPLVKTEEISSVDGRIYFRNLSKEIIDVLALKKDGIRVPFKTFHDCIFAHKTGKMEITYSYAPVKGTVGSKFEWDGSLLSPRTIAYGLACEYCILSGMTEEAALWDKRFKDSLAKIKTPKSELRMKERRWI